MRSAQQRPEGRLRSRFNPRRRTLEDVIAPSLRILFVGINPGVWSGALGFHFARPGNRFWKALHLAGLTPTLLTPDRQKAYAALKR